MTRKKIIGDKTVEVEVLTSSIDILRNKLGVLHSKYNTKDLADVLSKVKDRKLNTFVSVYVSEEKQRVYTYEELHKANHTHELLEVLLKVFENHQQYEVCMLVVDILDNK